MSTSGQYTQKMKLRISTTPKELIAALEKLPCCVVDAKGENTGDPLNIVVIGDPKDLYYAVIRAGWDETETVTAASGWKTATSFITGGGYRYSPVSACTCSAEGRTSRCSASARTSTSAITSASGSPLCLQGPDRMGRADQPRHRRALYDEDHHDPQDRSGRR